MPRRYGLIAFALAFLYYIKISTVEFEIIYHSIGTFAVASHIIAGLTVSVPELVNAVLGHKNYKRY